MLQRRTFLNHAHQRSQPQAGQAICRWAAAAASGGSLLRPAVRRRAGNVGRCRAETFEMQTVYFEGKEANWFAPTDPSKHAEGVVLFMHGYAQGPNAYYKMLQNLAEAGLLVIAPAPPFRKSIEPQQRLMVEYAAYFLDKIDSIDSWAAKDLKELKISKEAAKNVGLLGHSVGAGLATYVARKAADKGKPFKAVMYMAPQTQVPFLFDKFDPKAHIPHWPVAKNEHKTVFALQYGLRDGLAPARLARTLEKLLRNEGLSVQPSSVYTSGTHVGFQDQVVVGDAGLVPDILNKIALHEVRSELSTLKILVTRSPSLGLGLSENVSVAPQDIALLEQQAIVELSTDSDRDAPANCGKTKANGKGKPKHVTVPDPSAAAARYFELLVVTGCIGLYLGVQATDEVASKQRRRLLGGLTLLAGLMSCQGAIYVGLQEYVEMEQRPQSRNKTREFFSQHLLGAQPAAI